MAEREILRQIRSRAAGGPALRVGIGDDAAVLRVRPGEELVVTTDFSLEGVHFRRGWHPPEAVGHKCLARGLSDIAAMGARPVAAFLSLAVPAELTRARRGDSWVQRFYDGLLALAARFRVPLAGGDLAQAPGIMADIVVVGAVERGRALLRSTARPGDAIYVTGSLGAAAAELRALARSPRQYKTVTVADREHPHFFPEPRITAGRALVRRRLATAAIDISDGLSVDLAHLCEESGLRAAIDASLLPLHPASRLDDALHGGDDYELLFTASAAVQVPSQLAGVRVRRIGQMMTWRRGAPRLMYLCAGRWKPLMKRGWEHLG